MTPYDAQILIACCVYAQPEDYFPPPSPLLTETLGWMVNEDLIDSENRGTERAKVWLDAVLKTPLPIQRWIMPTGAA